MKLIENPIVGTTIGAGAMSAPLLSSIDAVLGIIVIALGGAATILVMVIHTKKNERGKKRHYLEMEKNKLEMQLLRKRIKHEDAEIEILKPKK